jgi:hypothetical protein
VACDLPASMVLPEVILDEVLPVAEPDMKPVLKQLDREPQG